MVKVDYNRDYYRDLELQPGADQTEIKKQFKKLALRYHPDRNPGRELEFNSKFQAIQSAHEVLTDPELRQKFDSNLRRLGRFNRPPPRPPAAGASPAQKQNTTWTQPNSPRPPQPSTQRPKYTSAPSSGASRYADFGSGPWVPPPRPTYDYQSRADTFRKWEHMTQNQNQPRTNFQPPPRPPNVPPRNTPKDGSGQGRRTARDDGSPKTSEKESAGEKTAKSRSSFPRSQSTRVPKKTGFDPGTPGGDEPPAPNTSAYFNVSRGDRATAAAWTNAFPQASKPRAPTAKKTDPVEELKRSSSDDPVVNGNPRVRSPYATAGGEKISLSGAGLGRSATTREVPRWTDWNTETPTRHEPKSAHTGGRGRSASPQTQNQKDHPLGGEDSSSSSGDSMDFGTREKPRVFKQATGVRGSRVRRQPGQPGARFKPFVEPDSSEDARAQGESKNTGKPSHLARDDPGHTASQAFSTNSPPFADRIRNWQQGFPEKWETGPEKSDNNIFNFPLDDQIFEKASASPNPLRHKNSSNINTTFSPEDWHGKFTGNPQDYFMNSPLNSGSSNRERPSSRSPQRDVQKPVPEQGSQIPAPSSSSENRPTKNPQEPEAQSSPPRKFSADEWKHTFKEPSFVFPAPAPAVSPVRATTRAPKGSRSRDQLRTTVKIPTVPKPASVSAVPDDVSEEENIFQGKQANGKNYAKGAADDSGVMDVDASGPIPAHSRKASPATNHAGPRLVSVEPTKPEWRENASHNGKKSAARPSNQSADRPTEPQPAPKPEMPEIDLSNLDKVEPLAPGQHGLKDLKDLSDTLPFESRPAPEPVNKPPVPSRLLLPSPPKGPAVPLVVNSETWKPYLENMRVYMSEWRAFNKRMLMHFNSRQEQVDLDLGPDFLGTIGEGPRGGFATYMQGLEEDFRVRAHWDVSWEHHRDFMVAFGVFRQKLLHAAQLG